MSRQLVRGVLIGLVCVASSVWASAQDARLVMREAIVVWPHAPAVQPNRPYPAPQRANLPPIDVVGAIDVVGDTTGMERAEFDGGIVYLGEVLLVLEQGSLRFAGVAENPFTGQPKVSLELAENEAERFSEITANRIQQAIAIVLDGRVLTAPTVQNRISNGRLEIAGVTMVEARELAATMRELTDAQDVEDWYEAQRLAARDSLDLSTPEKATDSFLRSVGVADWLTTASIIHPDALALIREEADTRLILEADSVGRIALNEYGWPDRSLGRDGRVFAVSDLLETEPPGDTLTAFSDEQVVVLMFALERGRTPDRIAYELRGALLQGDDTAHIVVELDQEDDMEDPGLSQARVFTARRVGTSWRLLIPAQGW